MRKILIISFILFGASSTALAWPSAFFVNDSLKAEISILTGLSTKDQPRELYFVNLDPSDCNSCVRSTFFISNLVSETSEIYILLNTSDLHKEKLLRTEFHLPESAICISKDSLPILSQFCRQHCNKQRSWICQLRGQTVSVIGLKSFSGKNSFAVNLNQTASDLIFDDTSFYYKGFRNVLNFREGYLALEYPGSRLLFFNNAGKYVSKLSLDSTQIESCFEQIMWHYSDSVKKLNSFQNSMAIHRKSMEPMGFSLLTVHNLYRDSHKIYAIGLLGLPVQVKPDDYEVAGRYFVCEIELVEGVVRARNLRGIQTNSVDGYWPQAINLFRMKNGLMLGQSLESDTVLVGDTLHLIRSYDWDGEMFLPNKLKNNFSLILDSSDQAFQAKKGNLLAVVNEVAMDESKQDFILSYYPAYKSFGTVFQKMKLPYGTDNENFTNYFPFRNMNTIGAVVMLQNRYFFLQISAKTLKTMHCIPLNMDDEILLGMRSNGDKLNYWALTEGYKVVYHQVPLKKLMNLISLTH